jgi:hypothetical protein
MDYDDHYQGGIRCFIMTSKAEKENHASNSFEGVGLMDIGVFPKRKGRHEGQPGFVFHRGWR